MAKLKIPAGIAKAIQSGKTVIWTQHGRRDAKTGAPVILPRINDNVAKYHQVDALIRNLGVRPWEVPQTFYLGIKEYGVVPAADLYVDVEILESYYEDSTGFEELEGVNFFSGDTTCKMEIYPLAHPENGRDYDFAYAEAEPDAEPEPKLADSIRNISLHIEACEDSLRRCENEKAHLEAKIAEIDAKLAKREACFNSALNDNSKRRMDYWARQIDIQLGIKGSYWAQLVRINESIDALTTDINNHRARLETATA